MSVSSSSRSLSDLKFLTPFQRKRKKKECYFSTFSFFSSSFCVFSHLSGEEEEEGVKKRKNEVAKTALQICFAAFLFFILFLILIRRRRRLHKRHIQLVQFETFLCLFAFPSSLHHFRMNSPLFFLFLRTSTTLT